MENLHISPSSLDSTPCKDFNNAMELTLPTSSNSSRPGTPQEFTSQTTQISNCYKLQYLTRQIARTIEIQQDPNTSTHKQRILQKNAFPDGNIPKIRKMQHGETTIGQYYFRTILDRVLGARAAGVHYRLISVWTLVPVRLGKQLSDHSTVVDFASEAADCRHTYTMANCPQRRLEKPGEEKGRRTRKRKKRELKKTRSGRFRKRRGESQSFWVRDADQESKTRMRNALRTGPRQAVE
ncbi:hypothetical protein TNCV_1175051 [Trichonephila clavipes]|nr:hypothetical protein TNCV_1175051 [Trichonephila clavipes]